MKTTEPIITADNWREVSDFIYWVLYDLQSGANDNHTDLLQTAQMFLDKVKAMEPEDVYSKERKSIRRFLEVARGAEMSQEREVVFLAIGYVIGGTRMEDEMQNAAYNALHELLDHRLGDAVGRAEDAFKLQPDAEGK